MYTKRYLQILRPAYNNYNQFGYIYYMPYGIYCLQLTVIIYT